MGIWAVDLNLVKNRERYAIIDYAELLNLFVRSRLLVVELVAGETQDLKVFILEFIFQSLQALELLSEAAFARRIENEQHLALVILH